MEEIRSSDSRRSSSPPYWPLCIVSVGAILFAAWQLSVVVPINLLYFPRQMDQNMGTIWLSVAPVFVANVLWIVVLGSWRYRSHRHANGRDSTL